MKIAGQNNTEPQQQYNYNNYNGSQQQQYMNQQHNYNEQTQQQYYTQPKKDSFGALLLLFLMSKGGKVLSTIGWIIIVVMISVSPPIAFMLMAVWATITNIVKFLGGKSSASSLIGAIIVSAIIFIVNAALLILISW